MFKIGSEFNSKSLFSFLTQESGNKTQSGMESLTLERQPDGFKKLVEKIEVLSRSGLKEDVRQALDMVRTARQDLDFEDARVPVLENLSEKLADTLHHKETISNPFLRSALHLISQPLAVMMPSVPKTALTMAPIAPV